MTIVACQKCGTRNRVDPARAAENLVKCGKCGAPITAPTGSSQTVLTVTDQSFDGDVLNAPGVVLVDCWAPWCGPCRMVAPIMDQLAAESSGKYTIAKLNVDENPRTSAKYQIQSIPTMLIFKNGQLIDRLIGAQPKPAIAAKLAQAA